MASSVSPTTCGSGIVFTGDRWTIGIGERCSFIWVIKTNSLIITWHLLGSRSTEMICQNLCVDSVHPSWIDKHERQHTTASIASYQFTVADPIYAVDLKTLNLKLSENARIKLVSRPFNGPNNTATFLNICEKVDLLELLEMIEFITIALFWHMHYCNVEVLSSTP